MGDFIKKACSYIFGYEKITKNIQCFIKLNQKHWSDIHGETSNGYILLPFKKSVTHYAISSRVAKSIEEETGCVPLAIIDSFGFSSKYWKRIYGSYNINNFIYYKNYSWNVFYILKSLYLSVIFCFKQKNIDDLLNLEFEGIYIGDLIYDTILRNNAGLYTINKVRIKFSYFKYLYLAYLTAIIYKKIFSKYNIKYVHFGLLVFIKWGIPARIADKSGAIVILARKNLMKNYKNLDILEGQYRPRISEVNRLKECDFVYEDADNYFNKRFSGDVNEIDVLKSYKGKKEYDNDSLVKLLNLDKNKPTVFIMPHAFSDGPHHTPIGKLLYKDFYVWFVETLKIVSTSKNANWIVKPHPMSFKYKEEGAVERLVSLYGKDNVKLCPKDLNTKSIKDIADAIITVQGKSGVEFSCFGIPAVVTSLASYSGFGVAVEPKTIDEYVDILRNIQKLPKLSEEQIKTAKVLSAMMFIYSRTNDPLLCFKQDILNPIKLTDEEKIKQLCALMREYDKSKDEFYLRIKDLLNMDLYGKFIK